MIQATLETSAFAHDLTLCTRCGVMLSRYDFGTDWLGRTIERCPKCGPALLPVRHGAPVGRARVEPQPYGKCEDCQVPMMWSGTGGKPLRCQACQKARRLIESREYKRDVTAHRRVVTPRRFSA